MEKPSIERINRLADRMAQLYKLGHNAVQSTLYEATRQEYLQAQTDLQNPDYPPGTYSHYTTG